MVECFLGTLWDAYTNQSSVSVLDNVHLFMATVSPSYNNDNAPCLRLVTWVPQWASQSPDSGRRSCIGCGRNYFYVFIIIIYSI